MSDYLKKRQQESLFGKPPKEDKKYTIPKVSKKRAAEIAAEKEARGNEDTHLQKWFKARQKHLIGACSRCGEKYNHKDFKEAIKATAHILPKRDNMFPSISLHPLNWIELGAYCGCHKWFDEYASWKQIVADPKIGKLIVERFIAIEPDIAEEERKHIPQVLKDILEQLNPFPNE